MLLINLVANDKANVVIKELTKNSKLATAQLHGLSSVFKTALGTAVAYAGIQQVASALTSVVRIANDYELAMRKVSVVGGVNAKSMGELDTVLKKYAETTEFSAEELAKASLEIIKMGVSADGVKDVLPDAMNMATVAGEELHWTSENLLNVMRAFGIKTSESSRVADILTIALNGTSMNLKDLVEGFTYVASISGSLNYGLEETTALLGILSDVGIKGSLGGTALKNSMLKLIDPTEAVSKALLDFKGEGKSLVAVLEHLNKKGLSVKELFKQFDLRALPAALVGGQEANVEKVRELMKLMTGEDIGGIAKAQADEIREAYSIAWKQVANEAGLAGIAFQEALGGKQTDIAKALADSLKGLIVVFKDNKTEIREMADTAIKGLNLASKLLSATVSTLTQNWKLFIGGLSVISIAGLATKIGSAIGKMKSLSNEAKILAGATEGANKAFSVMPSSLAGAMKSLNAYVIIFIALKETMDIAFSLYNKNLDRMQKNFAEDSGTAKMRDALSDITLAYAQADLAKTAFESNKGKMHSADYLADWLNAKLDLKKLKDAFNKEYGKNGEKDNLFIKDQTAAENQLYNLTKRLELEEKIKKAAKAALDLKDKELSLAEKLAQKEAARLAVIAEFERKKNVLQGVVDKGVFKYLDASLGQIEAYSAKTGKSKGLIWSIMFGDMEGDAGDAANEFINTIEGVVNTTIAKAEKRSIVDELLKSKDRMEKGKEGWLAHEKATKANKVSLTSSAIQLAGESFDLVSRFEDSKTERTIANLEREQEALEARYSLEDSLSESKNLMEILREKKRAVEQEKIDKKLEKEKAKMAAREKQRNIAAATQSFGLAILNTMSQSGGGAFFRLAQAGIIAVAAMPLLSSIINARDGEDSVDIVRGNGNSTSDSVLRRVSVGEAIIPERKVRSLGGSEKVKSLIDHGSAGNTLVLQINELVSDRELVERLAPRIKEALRW